jgi:hypothetical protein
VDSRLACGGDCCCCCGACCPSPHSTLKPLELSKYCTRSRYVAAAAIPPSSPPSSVPLQVPTKEGTLSSLLHSAVSLPVVSERGPVDRKWVLTLSLSWPWLPVCGCRPDQAAAAARSSLEKPENLERTTWRRGLRCQPTLSRERPLHRKPVSRRVGRRPGDRLGAEAAELLLRVPSHGPSRPSTGRSWPGSQGRLGGPASGPWRPLARLRRGLLTQKNLGFSRLPQAGNRSSSFRLPSPDKTQAESPG